jgi:uncharacterized protein (TIGR00251 family)
MTDLDDVIELHDTPRGVVFAVRAHPQAKRNAITGTHAGAIKVAVTAAADKGKANEAIVDVLSQALGIARSQVAIVSGATSRTKKVIIAGVAVEDLRRALAAKSAAKAR